MLVNEPFEDLCRPMSPAKSKKKAAEVDDELLILHFNDVYNIEARAKEPCGGVSRFVTKVFFC